MTRLELLTLIVGRARSNGFNFRRWYTSRLSLPWINNDAALQLLDAQRRYYALLFCHEFAQAFWKAGEEITFAVPPRSYQRKMPDGSFRTVQRKPFIRRSARPDVWRYHLREMAASEEPMRYIRRYLHVAEEWEEKPEAAKAGRVVGRPPKVALAKAARRPVGSSVPKPLPQALPEFLKRPYNGSAA